MSTTKKTEVEEVVEVVEAEVVETTAVAEVKKGSTAVGQTMASRAGFEKTDMSSIRLGVCKLLQSNSPEVISEEFEDYGFKPGKLIHSVLLEELSDTPFIPLLVYDDNVMFSPRNPAEKEALTRLIADKFNIELTNEEVNGQMIICRAADGKHGTKFGNCADCSLNKFDGAQKPVCNANFNVVALFEGESVPIVIRFTSTSKKHGEKFKQLAYYAGGDLFSRRYKLMTAKKSKDGNNWYELMVRPAGMTSPEEIAIAKPIHDELLGMVIEAEDPNEYTNVEETTTETPSY